MEESACCTAEVTFHWIRLQQVDSTQIVQTSTKASNLNQKWSRIRIRISGLILIRIRISAASLTKCCGFITLSASAISLSVVKIGRWEMLNKSEIHYSAMAREVKKSNPESVSGTGSPPQVNQFFRLVGKIITANFNEIGPLFLQ